MPRPVHPGTSYEPALDGLRSIAVIAVFGYHLEVPGFGGGLLGVGMFFTLSGFLITRILLDSWRENGEIDLREFWTRRARRLLPALVLVLISVLAATALVSPSALGDRTGESIWAMFYVSNWATIFSGASYFSRFSSPGPLGHLWSLAVEEQFYVLWPLLLTGILQFARGRATRAVAAVAGLATLSFVLLAVLSSSGFDNTRAYEGTDTRAGGLLVGAIVAIVWRPGRHAAVGSTTARRLDVVGGVAVGVLAAMVLWTDAYSSSLYTWGLLLLSVATAVLVAVTVHPASRTIRSAFSWAPLVWLGERSYGLYLWHLPVIAFTPSGFFSGQPPIRIAVQIAVTVALASASWRIIEDPIRRYGLRAFSPTPRVDPAGAPIGVWRATPTLQSSSVALVATLALVGMWFVTPEAGGAAAVSDVKVEAAVVNADPIVNMPGRPSRSTSTAPTTTVAPSTTKAAPSTTAASEGEAAPAETRTRCTEVLHVGDSTSIGLMAPGVLGNPADRIDNRYREVGATTVYTDISGARSIIETYKGQPSASTAVTQAVARGYRGCWVFAMGTNDSANQAVGSAVGSDARIDRLMKAVGDSPVMWLTVRTLRTSGPYANEEMQKWDAALVAACQRYPNMRVYDWGKQAQDDWFLGDGIHFTSTGYRWRAALVARALSVAFPTTGHDVKGCLFTPS